MKNCRCLQEKKKKNHTTHACSYSNCTESNFFLNQVTCAKVRTTFTLDNCRDSNISTYLETLKNLFHVPRLSKFSSVILVSRSEKGEYPRVLLLNIRLFKWYRLQLDCKAIARYPIKINISKNGSRLKWIFFPPSRFLSDGTKVPCSQDRDAALILIRRPSRNDRSWSRLRFDKFSIARSVCQYLSRANRRVMRGGVIAKQRNKASWTNSPCRCRPLIIRIESRKPFVTLSTCRQDRPRVEQTQEYRPLSFPRATTVHRKYPPR